MDTMKWLRQLPDTELLAFWYTVDARIADKIQVVRHADHDGLPDDTGSRVSYEKENSSGR